jgi:DNA-binding NarL/FixJ family response regulator
MKFHEEKDENLSLDAKPKNGDDKMIDWRRNKVLELSSQGNNQVDIASILQVSEPTVSRSIIPKEAGQNQH